MTKIELASILRALLSALEAREPPAVKPMLPPPQPPRPQKNTDWVMRADGTPAPVDEEQEFHQAERLDIVDVSRFLSRRTSPAQESRGMDISSYGASGRSVPPGLTIANFTTRHL